MRHVVLPLSGNRTRITNVNCNNKIGRDVLRYVWIRLWQSAWQTHVGCYRCRFVCNSFLLSRIVSSEWDPFSHIFKPLFALRGVWWTLCAHFRRRIHKIESVAEMIKEAKDIRFNPFKIDMLLNSHTIQKALCITKHISHYVSNLNLYESTKTQSNVHALDFVQHGPPFFFSWGRLSDIFVCCFFL